MTRAELVRQARTYLGVPYQHQGRTRDGADCVGLLVSIAADFGIQIPYSTNYDWHPDRQIFLEGALQYCDPIPTADRQAGDIGFFRMTKGRWHTGFFTDPDTLLHSSLKDRRVVEHRMDKAWLIVLVQVYRFKGVTG